MLPILKHSLQSGRIAMISACVTGALIAGCGLFPTAAPAPRETTTPSPTVTASPTPTPLLSPTSTNTPFPSPTPTPTQAPIRVENISQLVKVRELGSGTLNQAAVSPDGRTLAVAGSQGIWLYDKFSLLPIHQINGHAGDVNSVAWSPDGSRLVSGGEDGTVRVWEVSKFLSGEALLPEQTSLLIAHIEPVTSVEWSPDGELLASGGEDNAVWIWESSSGNNLFRFPHGSDVLTLTWHQNGRYLLAGTFDEKVHLWDAELGTKLLELEGHAGWINSVAWAPSGAIVASGGVDKTIRLWDINIRPDTNQVTANQRLTLHTFYNVNTLTFLPDSSQIASAGANPSRIDFWDISTLAEENEIREPLGSMEGHTSGVTSITLGGSGTMISTGQDATLRVWDIRNHQELRSLRPGVPEEATQPEKRTSHTGPIQSIAWAPDNSRVATGGTDNTVRVWDALTGEQLEVFKGHQNTVNNVDWSADGKWLASGSNDNTTRIWDAVTGEELQVLPSEGGVINSVAWEPFGTQLATGGFLRIVQIWDAATSRDPTLIFPEMEVTSLSWAPSGTLLAIGGADGRVKIWDVSAGTELLTLDGEHSNRITGLTWGPGSSEMASASLEGTVEIWNTNTGEAILHIPGRGSPRWGLSWSPSGNLLASGSGTTIQVWEAENGIPQRILASHTGQVRDISWSPDGKTLASAGSDGTSILWSYAENEKDIPLSIKDLPAFTSKLPKEPLDPNEPISSENAENIRALEVLGRGTLSRLERHPNGKWLAASGGIGTWVYDQNTLEPVQLLSGKKTYGLAWSPSGRLLATRELNAILVWDLASAQVKRLFSTGLGVEDNLVWSPDNTLLATGNLLGNVTVYNVATGKRLYEWQPGNDITSLAWSPDGRRLAAGGADPDTGEGDIWLWDIPSGDTIATLKRHTLNVTHISWSPDGAQLLSSGNDNVLRLWDLTSALQIMPVGEVTEEEEEEQTVPHDTLSAEEITEVVSLSWEPNGETFLVGDRSGVLLIWGAATHQIQSAIPGPPNGLVDAIWSADGEKIISISSNSVMDTWDVETGEKINTLNAHRPEMGTLAWSPTQNRLAVGGKDGILRVWEHPGNLKHASDPLPEAIIHLAYAPDGGSLATRTRDGGVQLWDTVTWVSEPLFEPPGGNSPTWRLAWSPDNSKLAWNYSVGMTHTIQIRGVTTETNVTLEGSETPITTLTWSPDSERLASGSIDGKVSIWNPDTGRQLRQFEVALAEINSITWSPDGRILATGGSDGFENQGNQTVRLWNASTGRLIREMALPFAHEAISLAWALDGRMLASGDSFGDLQIWDPETGERKINLTEHTQAITGVSWSGDGLRLATSSRDGTVTIWGVSE